MTADERTEKINIFLVLANHLPSAKETIDNVFSIVSKYDLPKHVDRDFIFDCLIEYYKQFEEYEKCAELYKFKLNTKRKKRITANKLTRKELSDLRMLGFTIPDSVKTAALLKFKNEK